MTTLIHVARRSGRMTLRTLKLVSWVYGIIVLVVLLTDPQLLKSGTFGPEWYSITTAIGTLVTLGLAVIAAGFAFFDTRGARVKERKASTSVLAAGLINLAVLLAGRLVPAAGRLAVPAPPVIALQLTRRGFTRLDVIAYALRRASGLLGPSLLGDRLLGRSLLGRGLLDWS